MKFQVRPSAAFWLLTAVFVGELLVLAGCALGLEQSSNRYEQLNIETKKLIDVLNKVTDEASAKAHQEELEEAGEKIRDVQKRIRESQEKQAKKGGGMGRITNFRQAQIFEQTGDAARRQIERIREADEKAGAIVDNALTGIELPEPPPEMPVTN